MAGFLVTQNFTWNSIPASAIYYVNSGFAANATAAINLAVATVENFVTVKATAIGATVVFGSSSVTATSA